MRKIFIACGSVLFVTGFVLVLLMILAWIGGAEASAMILSIVMGCLFIAMGRSLILSGKNFPTYSPADNSEVAQKDHAAARRMIIQALRIVGIIILVVTSLIVCLWMLFAPER